MNEDTIPISRPPLVVQAASIQHMPDAVRQALISPGAPSKPTAPQFDVALSSQGYFYPENSPLASGTIQLYEVTAKHEDILSNTNLLKKGTVLDEFLKAVIATPGVSLDDLLIGDKNSILFAARCSAYGTNYKTKIKCPSCETESNVIIDLNVVKIKPFDFSGFTRGLNQFTFTLPVSGKTVVWKLLTHKDEVAIDLELKNLAKMSAGVASPEVTTRLKYGILSIDGKSDRGYIKTFVDTELSARDSLAFRTNVRTNTPDMDMTHDYTCPHCGHEDHSPIPLGANFFWPGASE